MESIEIIQKSMQIKNFHLHRQKYRRFDSGSIFVCAVYITLHPDFRGVFRIYPLTSEVLINLLLHP